MSGGIDSSSAAGLLLQQGFDVSGVTMRLWVDTDGCTPEYQSHDAAEDAAAVARWLKIPHRVVDYRRLFKQQVVDRFVSGYISGVTPNPCTGCNAGVKFGQLLADVLGSGADYLATGHYARILYRENGYELHKGIDTEKDQSYFLYQLNQDQLARILFPLGHYHKLQIRAFAAQSHLPVKDRPESQDLCFLADNDYRGFIHRYHGADFTAGPICDQENRVLGRHKGLPFYTIGQRRGLGVSAGEPLYVIGLDVERNTVIVGRQEQRYRHDLTVAALHFIDGVFPTTPIDVEVKIRYTTQAVAAVLTPIDKNRAFLHCDLPVMDVAPGQSAVFYNGDCVIGGGIIEKPVEHP
jgi:tRNA-uridine 2-sulfurtransferase